MKSSRNPAARIAAVLTVTALGGLGALLWRSGTQSPRGDFRNISLHSSSGSSSSSDSSGGPLPPKGPPSLNRSRASVVASSARPSKKADETSPEAVRKETARKLVILDEILNSRNDNDPRLDREFNSLTPATKEALIQKYTELRAELRNEKGTVVFLLGRNLSTESDLNFMKTVLNEPSCLSLADCSVPDTGPTGDPDLSNGVNTTLDYPKIVALKSLELFVFRNPDLPLSAQASDLLIVAEQAGSPTVKRMASSIRSRLHLKS